MDTGCKELTVCARAGGHEWQDCHHWWSIVISAQCGSFALGPRGLGNFLLTLLVPRRVENELVYCEVGNGKGQCCRDQPI